MDAVTLQLEERGKEVMIFTTENHPLHVNSNTATVRRAHNMTWTKTPCFFVSEFSQGRQLIIPCI